MDLYKTQGLKVVLYRQMKTNNNMN